MICKNLHSFMDHQKLKSYWNLPDTIFKLFIYIHHLIPKILVSLLNTILIFLMHRWSQNCSYILLCQFEASWSLKCKIFILNSCLLTNHLNSMRKQVWSENRRVKTHSSRKKIHIPFSIILNVCLYFNVIPWGWY